MTLVAAVLSPHPPLLIPAVAAGAQGETAELRAACLEAARTLVATSPDVLVIVGSGESRATHAAGASGSLAGYGVPLVVPLCPEAESVGEPALPLSLTVGAWLLAEAGHPGQCTGLAVPADATAEAAAAIGAELSRRGERVGLLVMGDGSARRSEAAPGHLDERAEGFDAAVVGALRTGDLDALLDLDADLARDLLVAGRVPWQVLAGAAWGREWSCSIGYEAAPYGVTYVVATWLPA